MDQQRTIELVSARLESLREKMQTEVNSTPAVSPLVSSIADLGSISSVSPARSGYSTPPRGTSGGSPIPTAASNEALKKLNTGNYIKRLSSFMRCESECFLMALLLVERLASRRTEAIASGQLVVIADPSDPTGHSLRSAGCSPAPQSFGGRTPIVLSPGPERAGSDLVQEESLQEDFEIDSFADLQRKLDILRLFGRDKAQLLSAYLAAVVISIKLTSDDFQTNAHYALIGGLHAAVLCEWETKVMDALDYDVGISQKDFFREAAPVSTYQPLLEEDAEEKVEVKFEPQEEEEATDASIAPTKQHKFSCCSSGIRPPADHQDQLALLDCPSQPIPISSSSSPSAIQKQKKRSIFGTATFIGSTSSTSLDSTGNNNHGLSEDDDRDDDSSVNNGSGLVAAATHQ